MGIYAQEFRVELNGVDDGMGLVRDFRKFSNKHFVANLILDGKFFLTVQLHYV